MELEFMSSAPVGEEELFIYLDEAGASELAAAMERARAGGHDHLFTPDWGGSGLTASPSSIHTFRKVTITFGQE